MDRLTVFVVAVDYTVQVSPDPLTDDADQPCEFRIEHDDHVIWIDPRVPFRRRQRVILHAVSRAWREALRAVSVIETSEP